jgi:hypothetical protein
MADQEMRPAQAPAERRYPVARLWKPLHAPTELGLWHLSERLTNRLELDMA